MTRAFLLNWNPAKWEWVHLDKQVRDCKKRGSVHEPWSCGVRTDLPRGSVVYLMRLGVVPKGIVGVGVTTSEPERSTHWDQKRRDAGRPALRVGIDFYVLSRDPIVRLEELQNPPFDGMSWLQQASGVEIPEEIAEALSDRLDPTSSLKGGGIDELPASGHFTEGSTREVRVNAFERDPRARRACIAHYGAACVVCGINLERVYGSAAKGFIHVHHLVPLSEIRKKYRVDPVRDLRPLCPNCHAVIHLSDPPATIDNLKATVTLARVTG